MSKNCLIVKVAAFGNEPAGRYLNKRCALFPRSAVRFAGIAVLFCALLGTARAQDTDPPANATGDAANPADADAVVPAYPLSVAIGPEDQLLVVDLNLPGVWTLPIAGGKPQVLIEGSKRFRESLNRPRCCAVLSDGTVLVGDTATREIYALDPQGDGEPRPLTNGYLGVPVSLAVDAEDNVYIADLESRFIYKMPSSGGKPELFSKSIARGLFHDGTDLWAVTPTAEPLIKITDPASPEVLINERSFQFPHNLVVAEDGSIFVCDGYAKTIWKVVAGESPTPLFAGEPLVNPVGLAHRDGKLYVADPHAKQIFEIDITTKAIRPLVN